MRTAVRTRQVPDGNRSAMPAQSPNRGEARELRL
jgi:hypothetical protein